MPSDAPSGRDCHAVECPVIAHRAAEGMKSEAAGSLRIAPPFESDRVDASDVVEVVRHVDSLSRRWHSRHGLAARARRPVHTEPWKERGWQPERFARLSPRRASTDVGARAPSDSEKSHQLPLHLARAIDEEIVALNESDDARHPHEPLTRRDDLRRAERQPPIDPDRTTHLDARGRGQWRSGLDRGGQHARRSIGNPEQLRR